MNTALARLSALAVHHGHGKHGKHAWSSLAHGLGHSVTQTVTAIGRDGGPRWEADLFPIAFIVAVVAIIGFALSRRRRSAD